MKIVFVDKNKSLVKKVKELFEKIGDWYGMEFSTYYWDVFDFKKKNPDYKLCTASNPNFSMSWGLDAQIKKYYPDECNNLKEFVCTKNLFPIITVDNDIKSNRSLIKRALAGIYAHTYKFNFILTGIGTSIWWLDEIILLNELINLRYVNLSSVNLSSADLNFANLSFANLSSADLSFADLNNANLSFTNLNSADLSFANLSFVNLGFANLSSANLISANLDDVIINEFTVNFMSNCPEEWDFIWWKKCEDWLIVKLLIPAKAKRSNATSRKCRAEFVKTLEITDSKWKKHKEAISIYDSTIKYVVWKITKPTSREKDRWVECWWGIHFFITRWEAEQWG